MENRYDNRDFEQFVKQNADQYRMFPSEKVWKNIDHTLHHRNRWYGFGLALLILTTASVTWVMFTPSNKNQQLADRLPAFSPSLQIPEQKSSEVFIAPVRNLADPSLRQVHEDAQHQNLFMADISEQPVLEKVAVAEELAPAAILASNKLFSYSPIVPAVVFQAPPVNIPARLVPAISHAENNVIETPSTNPLIADEIKPVEETPVPAEPVIALRTSEELQAPMTIESVTNSFIKIQKKNKFSLQAYFTPTISYRRLNEENQFISETQARNVSSNATLTVSDVNSIVTHKPDFGLQIGVNGGYHFSPRLTFISGLQFNVSKYDIRAYNYPSETATIALMPGSSVETEATYRNYSGSKQADWLHNLYFSASIPIGMQLRLSGAGKTEIGVGGTIQPTYILGNRAYLLTTDYKNYVEAPSLIRRWNMSTSFEAYAGVSSGKIDWKIGPQVRYQLISSFRSAYPVKEHLFDFGLKVGIMLNK